MDVDHPFDEADDDGRPPPPLTWAAVVEVARERGRALARPALVLAGVVAALVVAWALFLRQPPPPPIEASLPMAGSAGPPAPASTATTVAAVVVAHAAGAVAAPGVHSVPAGARVADLLAAAGGPAPDADLDRVNLAAPVADGDQIWFPRQGETAVPPAGGGREPGDSGAGAGDEPVDLNTASEEELERLPGIGPTLAAAIVTRRSRDGPFTTVDELLEVRGIGEARLAELRDLVVVR